MKAKEISISEKRMKAGSQLSASVSGEKLSKWRKQWRIAQWRHQWLQHGVMAKAKLK
jgi:hypothetical protein